MKTEVQGSAELHQLCQLIENIPVAMLTLCDAHGALVSRPMAPLEMDNTGALWFYMDLHSVKLEHLGAANLSFVDSGRATYISVSGQGKVHTDRARIRRLWTPFAKPWFPEGPESPTLVLLKFEPQRAEYWDAPHNKMIRMFALAASVVAGTPIGLGEHDVLTDLFKSAPGMPS